MNRIKLYSMVEAFMESFAGTTVYDHRLFSVHATCMRMRLSCPGCNSKAYQECCIPLQGLLNDWLCCKPRKMKRLTCLDFVHKGQNLFITASPDTGKSYLTCTLGHEACKREFRTLLYQCTETVGYTESCKNQRGIWSGTQEDWTLPVAHPRWPVPRTAWCQGTSHTTWNYWIQTWTEIHHYNLTIPLVQLVWHGW